MRSKWLTAVTLAATPLFAAGFTSNAMAAPELILTDVTTGATTGPIVGSGGTVIFSGSVGNWTINNTIGTSISALPLGPSLDLESLNASTNTADTLRVEVSDIGFTTATVAFNTASVGNMIACTAGICSAAVNNYFSTSNTYFSEPASGHIDSQLGASASYNQAGSGAGTAITPYSLTIDLLLTETASGAIEWSTDSSIRGAVPEPASLTILGSALVGLGWLSRRRRKPV